MKKNRAYYSDIMRMTYPTPPIEICNTRLHQFLGIISPSKMFKAPYHKTLKYNIEVCKFLCFKRKINRYQWKWFYREIRKGEVL